MKITIFLLFSLAFMGCTTRNFRAAEANIKGTGLELIGEIESFDIYLNPTNNLSFAVFRENRCVVSVIVQDDGALKFTYYNEGKPVLVREVQAGEKILSQSFYDYSISDVDRYTYFDRDGDGLFEIVIDHRKMKKHKVSLLEGKEAN
jgi:hypothetical protein